MRKRILSLFCVLALCLTMLPATALAAYEPTVTGGSLGTDYTIGEDRVVTVRTGTALSISGNCEGIRIDSDEANIRLEEVWINSRPSESAITVPEGCDAHITLAGENRVDLMSSGALIQNGGSLTLNAEEDGSLTGSIMEDCPGVIQGGNVTILGGTYLFTSGPMEEVLYFDSCGSVSIQGGTFSSGSTADNAISGISVAQDKRVRITQINESTWGYEVVDESEIPEAKITGTGYSYENDILTLENDANVTVSSAGQVSTQIQVAAGAEASLTLDGITMLADTSCIRVNDGATLQLNLNNANDLTTWNIEKATISNAGTLIIDGTGTLDVGCIGEQYAAIIGGDAGENGGDIVIEGGAIQINALSSYYGTGIGVGTSREGNISSGGSTTVNGGTISIPDGTPIVGIGGRNTSGYEIEINGGIIELYGSPALGYLYGNGSIVINDGTVEASSFLGTCAIGEDFTSITINGGDVSATAYGDTAAIGGNGNSITISGGNVTASTYDAGNGGIAVRCGTAIGTSSSGHIDSILISGGHVTAINKALNADKNMGAAIGSSGSGYTSGSYATVDSISLTGGVIEAGTYDVNGNSVGNAIGMGQMNDGQTGTVPTVTLDGAAVIASSIQEDVTLTSGILFVGNEDGVLYGESVTLPGDFTIPEGKTLVIEDNQTLTIPDGVTLTNQGTITNNGTINNNGTLYSDTEITGSIAGTVLPLPMEDVPYLDVDGVKKIQDRATEVKADSTTWSSGWYVVNSDVTISNLVTVTGDVHLILADGCTLNAQKGISVNQAGASLTIYAQSTDAQSMGTLVATGTSDKGQAGIGGNEDTFHGSITINGGKITATAGNSAGIGGIAQPGKTTPSSSSVTINGGIVEATGTKWAPGIGIGGDNGSSITITINGGDVTAAGGNNGGSGIGTRENCTDGSFEITITGGTVHATGNGGGAGIGAGAAGGNSGEIAITGGTVHAQGGDSGEYGAGAGIGDGRGSQSTSGIDVVISGGVVTAVGGGSAAGIGAGTGDNGVSGPTGTFQANGNGVIFAGSISDQSSKETWNGVIFEGAEGQVYGQTVTPTEDFTIPNDYVLTVPAGTTLDISKVSVGSTGGTIQVSGTLTGDIAGGNVQYAGTVNVLISGQAVSGSYSAPYGSAITLTANIFNEQEQSNTNLLADLGTVNFYLGGTDGTLLGTSEIVVKQDNTYTASMEVSLSSEIWKPGTYTITADFGGIENAEEVLLANTGTAMLTVTKLNQAATPAAPTVAQRTSSSITLNALEAAGIGGVQYGCTTDGSVPVAWQSETMFSGLQPGTDYTFYARYAGDEYYNPAVSVDGTTASTLSTTQTNTVGTGETIILGDGTQITNNGETVTVSKGETTTTIAPAPAGGAVVNQNGSISLPGGSTVQTGSGPEITVNGDGATATPDGEVTLPANGSATISDGEGNTTTVTVPETGDTIILNENGSVTLPAGSTVQADNGLEITVNGDGATVAPDGEVTLPSSGSATISDGEGNTTTITVPESGGAIIPNVDGSVTLPGGSSVTVPDEAGGSTTVTVPDGGGTFDPSEGTLTRYYTVTFDSKGGSSVDSIVVAESSPVTKPADPTREGYTFTGWYQDAACTVTWDFASMTITGDTTLHAGWRQLGGSSGSPAGTVTGSGSNVSISASGGSVTAYQMESAVKKADEGATITIKATSSNSVSLPVGGMAEAAENDNNVLLNLRYGEVTLPAQAIAGLTDGVSSTGKIKVSITSQTSSKDETISDLLDKGAAVFDVSVEVGGESVHSFDGSLTLAFTVANLSKITDPHILHILTDGTKEYYAPDSIGGNTITIKGIRNLSAFAVIPGSEVPEEQANPFTDVYESDYYYDAVLWAVANGVTNGTSATTFSPDVTVTRAQMVTFLWRAYGSPEATGENPFTDVSESDYYYDAVLWAVENGVTVGTSATTFSPEAPVTRAQAVTFQWRAAGSPTVSGDSFDDVEADTWYTQAVVWAVANEITNGTGGNNFSPEADVSRVQAVTFLYRELG